MKEPIGRYYVCHHTTVQRTHEHFFPFSFVILVLMKGKSLAIFQASAQRHLQAHRLLTTTVLHK